MKIRVSGVPYEVDMPDLRKAAEMALEALDKYTCVVTSGTDPTKWNEVVDGGGPAREAAQALRQALEESANSTTDFVESKAPSQAEQEAFTLDRGCWERGCVAYDERDGDGMTVLKREWVGLTDKEIEECKINGGVPHAVNWRLSAKVLQAKLKEKNT